jgi:hypothetical protein
MSDNLKIRMLEGFSQFLDYKFIWKYDGDMEEDANLFKNYSNVVLMKWIPQMDLLSKLKNLTKNTKI